MCGTIVGPVALLASLLIVKGQLGMQQYGVVELYLAMGTMVATIAMWGQDSFMAREVIKIAESKTDTAFAEFQKAGLVVIGLVLLMVTLFGMLKVSAFQLTGTNLLLIIFLGSSWGLFSLLKVHLRVLGDVVSFFALTIFQASTLLVIILTGIADAPEKVVWTYVFSMIAPCMLLGLPQSLKNEFKKMIPDNLRARFLFGVNFALGSGAYTGARYLEREILFRNLGAIAVGEYSLHWRICSIILLIEQAVSALIMPKILDKRLSNSQVMETLFLALAPVAATTIILIFAVRVFHDVIGLDGLSPETIMLPAISTCVYSFGVIISMRMHAYGKSSVNIIGASLQISVLVIAFYLINVDSIHQVFLIQLLAMTVDFCVRSGITITHMSGIKINESSNSR